MARPAQGKAAASVPRRQRQPTRPTAATVTAQVFSVYRIKYEQALCGREQQEAFQAWAYLLRRAANLPLQEVANRSKVSLTRVSKIQRAIEVRPPSAALRKLIDKCEVKN